MLVELLNSWVVHLGGARVVVVMKNRDRSVLLGEIGENCQD